VLAVRWVQPVLAQRLGRLGGFLLSPGRALQRPRVRRERPPSPIYENRRRSRGDLALCLVTTEAAPVVGSHPGEPSRRPRHRAFARAQRQANRRGKVSPSVGRLADRPCRGGRGASCCSCPPAPGRLLRRACLWRRAVVAQDAEGQALLLRARANTVAHLTSLRRPSYLPTRRLLRERQIYSVIASVSSSAARTTSITTSCCAAARAR
jgi:hypothetical protein